VAGYAYGPGMRIYCAFQWQKSGLWARRDVLFAGRQDMRFEILLILSDLVENSSTFPRYNITLDSLRMLSAASDVEGKITLGFFQMHRQTNPSHDSRLQLLAGKADCPMPLAPIPVCMDWSRTNSPNHKYLG